MRLIDADELLKKMNLAIALMKRTMKAFDIEDDAEAQMELKAYEDIRNGINDEPTVHPDPHWIPCSERLPEEKDAGILKKLGTNKRSDYVIATVEVKGERTTVIACTYDGAWHWNMEHAFPDFKIVAWKSRPEPYRGDIDE